MFCRITNYNIDLPADFTVINSSAECKRKHDCGFFVRSPLAGMADDWWHLFNIWLELWNISVHNLYVCSK